MFEKIVWSAVVSFVVAIIYFSGDGFYRYPCQDPAHWETPPCKPPICLRTKNCATDLTGDSQ